MEEEPAEEEPAEEPVEEEPVEEPVEEEEGMCGCRSLLRGSSVSCVGYSPETTGDDDTPCTDLPYNCPASGQSSQCSAFANQAECEESITTWDGGGSSRFCKWYDSSAEYAQRICANGLAEDVTEDVCEKLGCGWRDGKCEWAGYSRYCDEFSGSGACTP